MKPHEYPRRVLLAASGLSPQIVTETLYALAVQQTPPFVPTEVRLLSTTEGAERARLLLINPVVGQFHQLVREYPVLKDTQFAADQITVVHDVAGMSLSDIRTPEDNAATADAILAAMLELTSDPHCALHVSIAGGRKTFGFYLGYALSLCGRPQDRLSHVLVNEPFESNRDFFFPPRSPRVIFGADGRPLDTSDAKVSLATIPFVRLRDGLPSELLAGTTAFSHVVAAAQRALEPPRIRIDLEALALHCGETRVDMQPLLMLWYAWLALVRCQKRGGDGFVRFSDPLADSFLTFYREVLGEDAAGYDRTSAALAKGMTSEFFDEKRAKVNRSLRRLLGQAAAPYLIAADGRRPSTRYGVQVDPARIEVNAGMRLRECCELLRVKRDFDDGVSQ